MLFMDTAAMFSVTQISRYLKELMETDEILQDVWVRGEISDCKTYSSGHCYFKLKDAEAQLACVFFKNARLRSSTSELRDGMAIAANGHISLYERDGKMQLYVENVEQVGDGALFLRFEQLKSRLADEGLFEESRKRPLPSSPSIVGIVTSPEAAALRDILRVLRTRFPLAQVILSPTLVQGSEAPTAIARALDLLNEYGKADVIILGRGGGSIEDLWAFNEEVVARAIARSHIPVISGFGHETDFTIADLVADYRASTPTAAAAAAVPDMNEWRERLLAFEEELTESVETYLIDQRELLARNWRDLQRLNPQYQLERLQQRLDDTSALLQARMEHILSLDVERLKGIALRLHSLSPLLTIARGFAVVRRDSDLALVTKTQQVNIGDELTIQVTDGQIHTQVNGQKLTDDSPKSG
jgi:exodeoxyribonuclease VII large subunit